jgi:tetratricopeptide (TPR) repeat protein
MKSYSGWRGLTDAFWRLRPATKGEIDYRISAVLALYSYFGPIVSITATVLNFVGWTKDEPIYGLYSGILYVITFVTFFIIAFCDDSFSASNVVREVKIEQYTQKIKTTPEDAEVYFLRGSCYGRQYELDNALADYEKALQLAPNSKRAEHIKAVIAYLEEVKEHSKIHKRSELSEVQEPGHISAVIY